ncbi:MAG: TrbC/VirB2 family protein [Alphaproteobacteria bacterium]|nr:TrbC/VirB2 family protein [Alphaproteobacteria bacterium]
MKTLNGIERIRAVSRRLRALAAACFLAAQLALAGLGALLPGAGPAPAAVAVAVATVAIAAPAAAQSYGGDAIFNTAETKAETLVNFLFRMARYAALVGVMVISVLAFFGKVEWSWVFYAALGALLLSVGPGLMDWASDGFTASTGR